MPSPKFHAATYNMVAKRIREQLEASMHLRTEYGKARRNGMIDIAMEFAKTFEKDNENFEPARFLDACSPDPETYPFSELWES